MQSRENLDSEQLMKLGLTAMNSNSGNRIDNLREAIDYFLQASSLPETNAGFAIEIGAMLAHAVREMLPLLTSQMSSMQAEYLKEIATAQETLVELTTRGAEDNEKQKNANQDRQAVLDREKREVEPLLKLREGLRYTSERTVKVLAWLFKPLLVIFVIMLVVTLATPAFLNWYFNNSALQLCSSDGSNLTISASSFLQPLLQKARQTYRQTCSHVSIQIMKTDIDGIHEVDTNAATIGIAETLADTAQNPLLDNQVAIRILAIIVNEKAGVSELSLENIREIYGGRVGNWRDVCYFDSQKKRVCGNAQGINIIGRPANSDIRTAFEQYVLGSAEYLPGTTISDEDNSIIQDVMNTPGAIGYVALSTAQQAHITPIAIDGILPSPTSIAKQEYKFWTVEHLYTRDPATDPAQKFIYFLRTNDGISLLHQYGFLSVTDIPDNVLRNHIGEGA